jgi:xanthine dehydrogenase iron-sulfur cluster and FAD-binding subunit A
MIMAAVALGPKPSAAEMRDGLAGNLCRCTGYSAIYRSIRAAGESRHRGVRRHVRKSRGRPSGRPGRSVPKKR